MAFTILEKLVVATKKEALAKLKEHGFSLVDKKNNYWMGDHNSAILTQLVASKRWQIKYTKPVLG